MLIFQLIENKKVSILAIAYIPLKMTFWRGLSNISLRGRVAFALCCLEQAIDKFGDKNSTWNLVLEKLWAFTDTKLIAEWQEMLAECIPGVILSNNFSDEFELITRAEFNNLRSLYQNTHIDLCKIVTSIFDIGSIELFDEEIEGYSEYTLKSLVHGSGSFRTPLME